MSLIVVVVVKKLIINNNQEAIDVVEDISTITEKPLQTTYLFQHNNVVSFTSTFDNE